AAATVEVGHQQRHSFADAVAVGEGVVAVLLAGAGCGGLAGRGRQGLQLRRRAVAVLAVLISSIQAAKADADGQRRPDAQQRHAPGKVAEAAGTHR
nr:hypothetical protein [Tanacetum cinerariifolium]